LTDLEVQWFHPHCDWTFKLPKSIVVTELNVRKFYKFLGGVVRTYNFVLIEVRVKNSKAHARAHTHTHHHYHHYHHTPLSQALVRKAHWLVVPVITAAVTVTVVNIVSLQLRETWTTAGFRVRWSISYESISRGRCPQVPSLVIT